jgi:long-chain acyl-CoA synthetase
MIPIPQRLLGEALLISSGKNPQKTVAVVKGIEYSYDSLKESSEKLAHYLVLAGIKKGDRVAVYMENSWQSIVSIYGITLAGGVFLVINPQTKANKLQYILNDCNTKILISESYLKNEFKQALTDTRDMLELILTGDREVAADIKGIRVSAFEDIIAGERAETSLPAVIPNDLAALIYTSGSTGFPKGVMMTHQSMVFTSWSLIQYLRLSGDDRIMLIMPLAFDYGLYQLLMAVTVGGTLLVEQSFAFPASVYKRMELLKPTVFPGVPTIFAMLIATHKKTRLVFESITTITNTAAALPAEFVPDLRQIFPNSLIFKMYGLTECKRVCYLEPELADSKPNSVGKAIPGTEVYLLSPEGGPVPAGKPGILHIRGPHVMAGYWNKDELSREMLKPGIIPGEKVLCSNDWFKMDDEGFLYFLGRNDDIIKTRGEKVSPVEIENIIYRIAGIKESAVMGVPDAIMGESIIAFVTCHDSPPVAEADILKECMTHLELFMIPKKVIFLSEMPRSPNGKIDKKELRNLSWS